jgi:ribosomal protein S18 acetylase RimI-like enzyme
LVSASAPNAAAIAFYEAAGFEPYSLELEMNLQDGVTV